MYVNTRIVKALMSLRGVSLAMLSQVTGISTFALQTWLNPPPSAPEKSEGDEDDDDDRLPFDRQLEILKILGIIGDFPREDILHHWKIAEPWWGDSAQAYEPLKVLLMCFGGAEVTYFAKDQDPYFSLFGRTHFGLTFDKFRVVLEVVTPPFKSVGFSPESLPNLKWSETGPLLSLPMDRYQILVEHGETSPKTYDKERLMLIQDFQWKRLEKLADERAVAPIELARWILEKVPEHPPGLPPASVEPDAAEINKVAPPLFVRPKRGKTPGSATTTATTSASSSVETTTAEESSKNAKEPGDSEAIAGQPA
jgi:hypothetical protein